MHRRLVSTGAAIVVTALLSSLALVNTPAAAATPPGALDRVTYSPKAGLAIAGWSAFSEVHLYVDGVGIGAVRTTWARPDVSMTLGLPSQTGFVTTARYDAPGGHTLCAYGIDPATGANPLLGCQAFVVGSPTGALDVAARASQGSSRVDVSGWATSHAVHIYANGQLAAAVTTGRDRPDVQRILGFASTGFRHSIRLADAGVICAYAIGGVNPLIGCASVPGRNGAAPPATTPAPAPAPAPSVQLSAAQARSLELLNALRADLGVGPVTVDAGMNDFAQSWSQTMAASGFRHSSGPFAENIAFTSQTSLSSAAAAELMHGLWADSAGHFRNMTNARWTRVGIGFYQDAGGWWATHVFQ